MNDFCWLQSGSKQRFFFRVLFRSVLCLDLKPKFETNITENQSSVLLLNFLDIVTIGKSQKLVDQITFYKQSNLIVFAC